jgi:hypothetical protein
LISPDHKTRARSPLRETLFASVAGALVIAFCFLLLWHNPLLFWNDDYEISVLPVFADVARSWSEGHLPLLSPYSWVCSNLAGEFQYGTFSVFVNAAVILIWKFPLTFPQQAAALSITHLFVLAAGAFLLARDRKSSIPLSIFVALVAALNGWISCWGATDWFGALGAFAWLPWAWWGLERALDRQRSRWRFLWPAPFVYLVITGGFPYTVLMLALLIAWLSIRSLIETKSFMSILAMFGGAALGFGLSAPAWLAIFDYVHGSAREVQPASAHWQWMVPITALPGFILPCWTVNWADFSSRLMPHTATEMACGLVPPIALLAALLNRGRAFAKQIRWELLLLLLLLLLSMLPSAGVFRWSFRWLPFFHLILALCAAEALRDKEHRGVIALLLVGVTTIGMSILGTSGAYAFPFSWILLTLAAVWAVAEYLFRNSKLNSWIPALLTLTAFLATYLYMPTNPGVPKYNLSQALTNADPLDPSRLYLSVYPPPEFAYRIEKAPGPVGEVIRPGSTSMWGRVHLINGYSPIRPAGVAREFGAGIHGEIDPGIAEYLLEWQGGTKGRLAVLGVDGILVASQIGLVPKPESEWSLAFSSEEGRVYHRRGGPLPRVRSLPSIDSRPNEPFATASIEVIENSRNRVVAEVDVPAGARPALVTISRPYFRGYEARLGRQRLAVASYRSLFPTVEIPAGAHGRLVLTYCPWWLKLGLGLSTLSAIFVLTASLLAARAKIIASTFDIRHSTFS